MTLIDFIVNEINTNKFASAAVIAGLVATATLWARQVPFFLFHRIRNAITVNIQINSDKPIYSEALAFLTKEVIVRRFVRKFVLASFSRTYHFNGKIEFKGARFFEVGYGSHIGFYKGRLVVVTRYHIPGNQSGEFKETCSCNFFFGSNTLVEEFIAEIGAHADAERQSTPMVTVISNTGEVWGTPAKLPLRSLNTVFLPNDIGPKILKHLRTFDAARDRNHALGLPHRTGILLPGPAGTGKSSLIHALASETGRSIFFLDLSKVTRLYGLLSSDVDWNKAFLVVEDIDAAGVNLNRGEPVETKQSDTPASNRLSLTTLLNALDGLISPDGLVVIATTNHPEKLDPALRRPGRFDLTVEIGFLGKPEFEGMAKLFDLDPSEYSLDYFEEMTGATLRKLLLEGGVSAVMEHQKELHQKKQREQLHVIEHNPKAA